MADLVKLEFWKDSLDNSWGTCICVCVRVVCRPGKWVTRTWQRSRGAVVAWIGGMEDRVTGQIGYKGSGGDLGRTRG